MRLISRSIELSALRLQFTLPKGVILVNLWGNILIFALLFSAPTGWGTASTSIGHWSGSQEKETNPSTFEQLQEKVRLLEGSTDPNVWSDILALTGELESQNNSEEEKKLIEETRKKVNAWIALENVKTQPEYSTGDNKPNFTEAQELLKMREGLDPILSEGERKQFDKILTEKINSLGFKYDPKNGLQTRAQSFGQGPNIFVPPSIKSDSLGSVLGPVIPTPSYNFSDANSSPSKPGNNNNHQIDSQYSQTVPLDLRELAGGPEVLMPEPIGSMSHSSGGETFSTPEPSSTPDLSLNPNPSTPSNPSNPDLSQNPNPSTPSNPSTPDLSLNPNPSTPSNPSNPEPPSNPPASSDLTQPSNPAFSNPSTPSGSSAGGSSTHSGSASSGSSTSGGNTGSSSSSPAAPQVATGSLAPNIASPLLIPTTSSLDPARDPASLGNSTPASTSSASSSPITSATPSNSTADKSTNVKLSPEDSPQGSSTPTNPIDAAGFTNESPKITTGNITQGENVSVGNLSETAPIKNGDSIKTQPLKAPEKVETKNLPEGTPIQTGEIEAGDSIKTGKLEEGSKVISGNIEKGMELSTQKIISDRNLETYFNPLPETAEKQLANLAAKVTPFTVATLALGTLATGQPQWADWTSPKTQVSPQEETTQSPRQLLSLFGENIQRQIAGIRFPSKAPTDLGAFMDPKKKSLIQPNRSLASP